MPLSEQDARELHEMVTAALEAVRNGETAVVAELERAQWLVHAVLSEATAPPVRKSSVEDALYTSVAHELEVPFTSVSAVLAHRLVFDDAFWALWDASVSSAIRLYVEVAGGCKVAVYGWFDGVDACEPPEPGKRWMVVAWVDHDGGMGGEIATFVQRLRGGVYKDADADRVVANAERVAAALNGEADRVIKKAAARLGEE